MISPLRLVALVVCSSLPAVARAQTPTLTPTPPVVVADVNCDDATTSADYPAAVLVSADPEQFPDCVSAGPFRGQPLDETNLPLILYGIYNFFDTPWTPTPTATATITPTRTNTRTRTPTLPPTVTPTDTPTSEPTLTPSFTAIPTATPSHTFTATKTPSVTPTRTATVTPTRTPTVTRIPTGLAYALSGRWFVNWQNDICFLNGQPFFALPDAVYIVTAINGEFDIETEAGFQIGRGLRVQNDGTVLAEVTTNIGRICPINNRIEEFQFFFTFLFQLNGTGQARAEYRYAYNTNCAVCSVVDNGVMTRVGLPGS